MWDVMKEAIFLAQKYIVEVIKMYLVVRYIFRGEFRKNKEHRSNIIHMIALTVIVGLSITHISIEFSSKILSLFWIGYILLKFKSVLIVFLSYFLITFLDFFIGVSMIWIFEWDFQTAYDSNLVSVIVGMTSLILLAIFSSLRNRKTNSVNTRQDYVIGNLLCFGLITCSIPIARSIFESNKLQHRGQAMIGLVLILGVLWIAYLRYQKSQVEKENYKKEVQIQEKFLQQQKNYYDLLLKKERQTKRFRHDIKQQLRCIYEFEEQKEYEKSKAYVQELLETADDLSMNISTGNEIVNIVVADTMYGSDAVVHWEGMVPAYLKMKQSEICVLFANLLKNAFEAVEQIEEKDVWVEVREYNEHLFIHMRNAIKESVVIEDGRIETTKEEEDHGYGLENVQEIVRLYHGSVDIQSDESYFNIDIMLQNVVE